MKAVTVAGHIIDWIYSIYIVMVHVDLKCLKPNTVLLVCGCNSVTGYLTIQMM